MYTGRRCDIQLLPIISELPQARPAVVERKRTEAGRYNPSAVRRANRGRVQVANTKSLIQLSGGGELESRIRPSPILVRSD
jgi:hypothetical protein